MKPTLGSPKGAPKAEAAAPKAPTQAEKRKYSLKVDGQDIEEELDPALEPVLTKSIIKRGTRDVLRLGDKELDYNPDFRLYITTKLANPHYTPEVSTKATIVNFAVKEQGLEAQLLGAVVRFEEPALEEEKSRLVLTVAGGKRKLAELESTILRLLSEVKGSLLDDADIVAVLQASKTTSEEVTSALVVAEATEIKIDAAREGYRPVARRAALHSARGQLWALLRPSRPKGHPGLRCASRPAGLTMVPGLGQGGSPGS
jgi:hypothetical protein